jgi:membrane protein
MAEQRDDTGMEVSGTQHLVRVGGNRVLPVPDREHGLNPLRAGNRLSWASWRLVARRVGADFFLNAMMDRGAVLTFFTVLTFAPTVLAAYSIATLVLARNEAQVTSLTTELIEDYVPADLADDVRDAVTMIVGAGEEGTVALVISVVFALLASSAYVRAFARAANVGYGRVEGRNVVRTWATMWGMTLVLVVGIVALIGALLLRESIVERFVEPVAEPLGLTGAVDFLLGIFLPVWQWLRFPVVIFLAVVLVAVLYYFAPNVKPTKFRWLTLGSASALLVSGAVWSSFSWYFSNFAGYSSYGAIGTILALLAALWVSNIVLVLGLKIDAEVLRAKELQVGLDSERDIQVPPRSSSAARQYAKTAQELEAAGRSIKEMARRRPPRKEGQGGGDADDEDPRRVVDKHRRP